MKKIFWCLIFALVLSIRDGLTVGSFALAKTTVPANISGNYYLMGIDTYKKGAYDKACSNLEHAVKISPKNVNARYYLAQAYLGQKRIPDAINQYNRIILLAPTSDAAMLSGKGLSLIQKSYEGQGQTLSGVDLTAYKDNYLDYVLTKEGQIIKWQSFPVKVYIEPQGQSGAVKKAFDQWQAKSKNLVSFDYTNSFASAQIIVKFKTKLENTSTQESFLAGDSKPYFEDGYMKKSEISILTANPETKKAFDGEFIYATALHEIGHSLGFRGHSPNDNDVMAGISSVAKTVRFI